MDERYLYYTSNYGRETNRAKITRETNSNIWVECVYAGETRISKKTMSTGEKWNITCYEEESPERLKKYEETQIKRRFKRNIGILDRIVSIEKMEALDKFMEGME